MKAIRGRFRKMCRKTRFLFLFFTGRQNGFFLRFGDTDRSNNRVPGGFWAQKSHLLGIPVTRFEFGGTEDEFGRFDQVWSKNYSRK